MKPVWQFAKCPIDGNLYQVDTAKHREPRCQCGKKLEVHSRVNPRKRKR